MKQEINYPFIMTDKPLVYYSSKADTDNIRKIVAALNFPCIFKGDDYVACKIHFGEPGNTAYLKPQFVQPIITELSGYTKNFFLTDTNTLYKGSRSDAVNHLKTAAAHGYNFAPVIIADGLRGQDLNEVEINQKHFKKVKIASALARADKLLVLTHFKGHEMTGFGGALKNLGMGCGSRAGKQQMHADFKPKIKTNLCKKDGSCAKWCPTSALQWSEGKVPVLIPEKCIGCGECLAVCRFGAISEMWNSSTFILQEKIVEYAYRIKKKHPMILYFNFLMEISPNCDCYGHNDPPVVPDLGVLASFDPVAIDQASIDLVNQKAGKDIFKALYSYADWNVQLSYAEQIGLGKRDYELQKNN
ncbi:MAG: DUF362 domain-containing protein [Candidatus Saganbacteria bacterium]|nr:DUF362 domain-containing protein [Candidatus Saganbacteria bacterium]